MMNMEQLLAIGEEILIEANIEEAKTDAWILMEYTFCLDRVSFWLNSKKNVDEREKERYLEGINKRAKHIPLQYITGKQEFMGLSFKVTPQVLIPRQDTEILVETALMYSKDAEVLDLCTGSGCIIISMAKLSPLKKAVGADISSEALLVARENAERNQVSVEWRESDLFENLEGTYDLIVSNPPYIESSVIRELMPEVSIHEPKQALDGAEDGLYFYKKISEKAKGYLKANGRILFEIGYNQRSRVTDLLIKAGFFEIEVMKDLQGFDRVITGKYNF